MKKLILLFLFLLPLNITAQVKYLDIDIKNDPNASLFHPIFSSNDEMIGKNVRFYRTNYKEQIPYISFKRGRRLVKSNDPVLPYSSSYTYYVEDIIVDNNGWKYAQILDKYNNKSFYYYLPKSTTLCDIVYDVDELERMNQYAKEQFVYRRLEIGESNDNQPFQGFPYVAIGNSGVEVISSKNGLNYILTAGFYYFVDGKSRFIKSDDFLLYTDLFLTEEELLKKKEEYQVEEAIRIEKTADNIEKYGATIAGAIYQGYMGGFWTQERVDELIKYIGLAETEYVVSGKVHIGMSKDLCEISWGKPDRINKTTYSFGTREQWVYQDKNSYLYFEDDVLTAISENK